MLSLKKEWKFVRNLSGDSPAGTFYLRAEEHENMVCSEKSRRNQAGEVRFAEHTTKNKNLESKTQWRFKFN